MIDAGRSPERAVGRRSQQIRALGMKAETGSGSAVPSPLRARRRSPSRDRQPAISSTDEIASILRWPALRPPPRAIRRRAAADTTASRSSSRASVPRAPPPPEAGPAPRSWISPGPLIAGPEEGVVDPPAIEPHPRRSLPSPGAPAPIPSRPPLTPHPRPVAAPSLSRPRITPRSPAHEPRCDPFARRHRASAWVSRWCADPRGHRRVVDPARSH
jgi:hypothetical protein